MSISLAEASKLSTDILLKGIVETIVKDSPILQELPFIQIVGNSLKYNREKTLPTVAWYDPVTDTWTTSEPEFEQCSASLGILGGDADVDNFLRSTRSNIQDLEAAVIAQVVIDGIDAPQWFLGLASACILWWFGDRTVQHIKEKKEQD